MEQPCPSQRSVRITRYSLLVTSLTLHASTPRLVDAFFGYVLKWRFRCLIPTPGRPASTKLISRSTHHSRYLRLWTVRASLWLCPLQSLGLTAQSRHPPCSRSRKGYDAHARRRHGGKRLTFSSPPSSSSRSSRPA